MVDTGVVEMLHSLIKETTQRWPQQYPQQGVK